MQSSTRTVGGFNKRLWAGRIISALPALLLLITSSMKLMKAPVAVELMARLGYPEHLIFGVGILELACVLVYIIPHFRSRRHPAHGLSWRGNRQPRAHRRSALCSSACGPAGLGRDSSA